MPELPDLQVFCKNLNRLLRGKRVSRFVLADGRRTAAPESRFRKRLEKQCVTDIRRNGKQLFIDFTNGAVLGIHMMLHGDLQFSGGAEPPRFCIFQIVFDDHTRLALTDWQRSAIPILDPSPPDVPDALSKDLNLRYLKSILNSRAMIKNLLTDQDLIRGIGNAYADEILWEARISPFSVASAIPKEKVSVLLKSIKKVLVAAEKEIMRKHPDIIHGEIRDFLKIHQRSRKTSPGGASIIIDSRGGRKTYYTEEQVFYG